MKIKNSGDSLSFYNDSGRKIETPNFYSPAVNENQYFIMADGSPRDNGDKIFECIQKINVGEITPNGSPISSSNRLQILIYPGSYEISRSITIYRSYVSLSGLFGNAYNNRLIFNKNNVSLNLGSSCTGSLISNLSFEGTVSTLSGAGLYILSNKENIIIKDCNLLGKTDQSSIPFALQSSNNNFNGSLINLFSRGLNNPDHQNVRLASKGRIFNCDMKNLDFTGGTSEGSIIRNSDLNLIGGGQGYTFIYGIAQNCTANAYSIHTDGSIITGCVNRSTGDIVQTQQ